MKQKHVLALLLVFCVSGLRAQNCYTDEQIENAVAKKEALVKQLTAEQFSNDSLLVELQKVNRIIATDTLKKGNVNVNTMLGGNTFVNVYAYEPTSNQNAPAKLVKSEVEDSNPMVTNESTNPTNTNPVQLSIGTLIGTGTGGDVGLSVDKISVGYRGYYQFDESYYNRLNLSYRVGKIDLGIATSLLLEAEDAVVTTDVATGEIQLDDEIFITTEVDGALWVPNLYRVGLFAGGQFPLNKSLFGHITINPMVTVHKNRTSLNDFALNADLALGINVSQRANLLIGGAWFNATPSGLITAQFTF